VEDNLEFAVFWSRTIASSIDQFLLMVFTWPILFNIYGRCFATPEEVVIGSWHFLISWIFPAVAPIVFWVNDAATPGKMAMNARILDAKTGTMASTGQLIGRYLAYFLSTLPFCLGFFWIAFDKRKLS